MRRKTMSREWKNQDEEENNDEEGVGWVGCGEE